jgi:hypothetical protein
MRKIQKNAVHAKSSIQAGNGREMMGPGPGRSRTAFMSLPVPFVGEAGNFP